MIGILGGGFGLYGYLPACVHAGHDKIALLERYKTFVSSRNELTPYIDNIKWVNDEVDLLKSVKTLILARRPEDNFSILTHIINDNIHLNLIIEKPPAPTPKEAIWICSALREKKYNFRIAFIFVYTSWFKKLEKTVKERSDLEHMNIVWQFRAHHIAKNLDNWKRYHSEGGGVLRFYAIHIIAILAKIGWTNSFQSYLNFYTENQPSSLKFSCDDKTLPLVDVDVSCDSERSVFKLLYSGTSIEFSEEYSDPFLDKIGLKRDQGDDIRVRYLTDLLNDLSMSDESPNWYINFTKLWDSIEGFI